MRCDGLRLLILAGLVGYVPGAMGQTGASSTAPASVSAIRSSGPSSGTGMSIKFLPGGRLVARNVTLRVLIKIGYNLNDDQLSGGPSWAAFKRFDIDAKPDASPGDDSATMTVQERQHYNQLLMRSLLADRFHLQLRSDTKDMSLYALVVAKSGARLKKSQGADSVAHLSATVGRIRGDNATMDDLANELGDKAGHPVENMTGLDGRYDFKVEWTPDSTLGPAGPNSAGSTPDAGDSGVDLFTAVQQQLGLKLEPRKKPAPYEVIESVQMPSEN